MVITAGAEAASSARAYIVDPATVDAIAAAQDELDRLADALSAKMADLHALQDKFEAAAGKQAKMLKSLNSTRKSAKSAAARRAAAAAAAAPASPDADSTASDANIPPSTPTEAPASDANSPPSLREAELDSRYDKLTARLRDRQRLMPSTGGMFVELFLGSINVRFQRKSERLAFKTEYEGIKLKLAPIFVFFCVLCLALPANRWLHMILQLALSCYYVTLAIRENILRVNGSNIHSWWIIHHYFTMMQGVLLLTWPNGASYAAFRSRLHIFGLYNAVLMIFQTRYQMARLYTLRSLGRVNEMDVASSDNTQIHWSETMTLLLPHVIFGQLMQGYQAFFLIDLYGQHPNELQILLLAILFAANFIGNTTTTMRVVTAKRKTTIGRAPRRPYRSASSASLSSRVDSKGTSSTIAPPRTTLSATNAKTNDASPDEKREASGPPVEGHDKQS